LKEGIGMNKQVKRIAFVGVMAAIAIILEIFEFAIPIVPSFLKFDFSELPALIVSFVYGPISGVIICLIKNIFHIPTSSTGGIGELANFLVGAALVIPAGLIYKINHNRKGAYIGALVGAVIMAALSLPINLFVTYPVYYTFMPKETIISLYKAIYPGVNSIIDCLIIFNIPFTLAKGLISGVITILIYKRISFLIKGKSNVISKT
jgi:riboflavin transporter FmnP